MKSKARACLFFGKKWLKPEESMPIQMRMLPTDVIRGRWSMMPTFWNDSWVYQSSLERGIELNDPNEVLQSLLTSGMTAEAAAAAWVEFSFADANGSYLSRRHMELRKLGFVVDELISVDDEGWGVKAVTVIVEAMTLPAQLPTLMKRYGCDGFVAREMCPGGRWLEVLNGATLGWTPKRTTDAMRFAEEWF